MVRFYISFLQLYILSSFLNITQRFLYSKDGILNAFILLAFPAIGTSPAIVYITEVARPDLRGSLMSTAPTIASFGKFS